jgi:hypothetical protein
MNIIINDSKKLSEISDQFSHRFPFLKIEFFCRPHDISDLSKMKFVMDQNKTVGECRKIHSDCVIQATGKEKVWQIEQEFQKYGLPVQIFRKGLNSWIETIQTDWWTLEDQNEEGMESQKGMTFKIDTAELDNFDYNNI